MLLALLGTPVRGAESLACEVRSLATHVPLIHSTPSPCPFRRHLRIGFQHFVSREQMLTFDPRADILSKLFFAFPTGLWRSVPKLWARRRARLTTRAQVRVAASKALRFDGRVAGRV